MASVRRRMAGRWGRPTTTKPRTMAGLRKSVGRVRRLCDVAKLLGLSEALELLERLVLDLADALAGDVERPPDLVEGARVLAAQPVAKLEDTPLPVGEV